jgi:uncharacterized membrane protein (UPF0127 family)
VTFAPSGTVLQVRVADTPQTRATGLMGVTRLPADQGLAFVFDAPTTGQFWMKDTLIPLSIAFVDGTRVIGVQEMVPCTSDPCELYDAGAPYTTAIEANAGYFQSHHVGAGSTAVVRKVGASP